ncbi:pyocin knob domain-containing protein [Comamonas testosteroni]|uniref:pyocin knob domain-containing protein n=1 Tax=Comamonas testosteroni TaxID=285 RepID=UPI0006B9F815|nr:pyocin knob domain-containing protein [Comamonas testosteroni]
MTWYRDGSINLTAGSNAVMGTGTAWLNLVLAGEGLDAPDGRVYEVAEVVSNSHLRLTNNYLGATAAGAAYQIIPNASMTKVLTRRVSDLLSRYETELPQALAAKVDVVQGKGLSSNDYTNDERAKLANIQAAATKNLADAVLLERSNHTGGFNGFGTMNLMANSGALPASSPPNAFFSKGTFVGMAESSELGIPLPSPAYGVVTVHGQWGDASAGYAVSRIFLTAGARTFASYALDNSTWSAWKETAPETPVRVLNEPTIKGFLQQMHTIGAGYYRNDASNPVTQVYSAGFFSKVADTWSFISVDRLTGMPMFMSGSTADIDAGTQKMVWMGTAGRADVQTSKLDVTAGRLMAVGAFGLGTLSAASGVDLNNFSYFPTGTSYQYHNGAINGPYPDFYGYLTVEKVDNLYLVQTAKVTTSGVAYRRAVVNGVKGAWMLVIDTQSAVGTIATGSIFETGSNANGTYTKFADGMQICTHVIGGINPANPSSVPNIYRSNSILWTYPATFVSNVALSHGEIGGIGLCWTGLGAVGVSTSSGSVCVYSMTQTGTVTVGLTAIGRWK